MSHKIYQTLREVLVLLEFSNHRTLAPFELDNLEYGTLLLLNLETGWRLVDLRERLLCDKSKMTRIIDYLEGRGLVERHPDPDDRRAWQVFLTENGLALLKGAQAAFLESLRGRFAVLDAIEQEQLHTLLETLRANLSQTVND
jgi:DNA-binding MarR family transcriptional regulator